jgi:hypothetical protein
MHQETTVADNGNLEERTRLVLCDFVVISTSSSRLFRLRCNAYACGHVRPILFEEVRLLRFAPRRWGATAHAVRRGLPRVPATGDELAKVPPLRHYCIFRGKPATDSDANRPLIPTEAGHPFRSKPATLWRVVEALSCSATESPDQTPFAAMQGEVRCLPRERRCGRFGSSEIEARAGRERAADRGLWADTFNMVEHKVLQDRVVDPSVAKEATQRLATEKPFG